MYHIQQGLKQKVENRVADVEDITQLSYSIIRNRLDEDKILDLQKEKIDKLITDAEVNISKIDMARLERDLTIEEVVEYDKLKPDKYILNKRMKIAKLCIKLGINDTLEQKEIFTKDIEGWI
jgi:hypothetical protein